MIYLGEHEIGSDGNEIGFPSVDDCRAIVLVTAGHLYGYHLAGNMNQTKQTNFINFVNPGVRPVLTMYCASNAKGAALTYAKQEVTGLAGGLGYRGRIYWSEVGAVPSIGNHSAYVYFFRPNDKCVVQARLWNDAVDGITAAGTHGPYNATNRTMAHGGRAPGQMYTHVNPAGLATIYPTPIN